MAWFYTNSESTPDLIFPHIRGTAQQLENWWICYKRVHQFQLSSISVTVEAPGKSQDLKYGFSRRLAGFIWKISGTQSFFSIALCLPKLMKRQKIIAIWFNKKQNWPWHRLTERLGNMIGFETDRISIYCFEFLSRSIFSAGDTI